MSEAEDVFVVSDVSCELETVDTDAGVSGVSAAEDTSCDADTGVS